jgi:hypothetical protein
MQLLLHILQVMDFFDGLEGHCYDMDPMKTSGFDE